MINSAQLVYTYTMKQIFTLLILVFLPIYTKQISTIIKDPFEYFKKLARDIQIYSQCDRVPPFKTQLDASFFDIDLRQWDRKKNPPPIHRSLEAFVQLDTLRQSTYFSHILQGNSQANVPGILNWDSIRLYDHRKLSTQLSSPRQYESSINGLVSYFMLSDRKEQRRSRITSVVFNQHGTEILASYSSDSVYLLNPKQLITQEQMKERLIEHRNKKQSKININETKPTPNNIQEDENKTSPIKRLRLRGDWSDTGPDSRPIQEEEQIEPTTNQSESSNEQQSTTTTTPGRDLQNFFMRRMSDILTQLVTRTTSETEQTNQETETTTTPNNTQTNETNDNDNNNDSNNNIASSPTTNSPMVQSSPSPTPVQNSTTTNNDDEDDHESNRIGIFDLIFGGSPRFHTEEEDDNDDDNDVNHMDDDDDDEDSRTSSVTTDNVHSSEHTHHRFLSTKWDRMRKRREVERVHEENLLKSIPSLGLINSYDGHRNTRTMIKEANFWSDSYVMSGSDCGHIFIWNKFNGNIIRVIQADEHVVNCVQPHPLNYPILASSGIDYNIKIFSPLAETPIDDSDRIERTVKRNYAMIEETSSTITVPATFMLRMLTSIYRLRHREGASGVDDDD
ncbi:unnamed protein product [Rotaria sp. Silwood2]|nr:unnamed protein product [Rotaria sp. Silwood2]